MSKKNMKKKAKVVKESKPINKKLLFTILIMLAAFIVVGGIVGAVLYNNKKRNDVTIKVAFCNLPDLIEDSIKGQFENKPELEGLTIQFSDIDEEQLMDQSIFKKYDFLFAWNGAMVQSVVQNAQKVPERILNQMPNSIRGVNENAVPVVLDHYEFNYYLPMLQKYNMEVPLKFSELEEFLEKSKVNVFCPFICEGSNDQIFLALYSVIAESLGGLDCYNGLMAVLKELESGSDIDSIFEKKVGSYFDGKKEQDVSLKYITDIFLRWQKTGITHPQWSNAKKSDVLFFLEDHQVAVLFTSLQQHRTIKYNTISAFQNSRSPVVPNQDHGLISPAVMCVPLRNNLNYKKVLEVITRLDVQQELSFRTMLAPVNSRAECYDIQADDVRYFAASCKGGPLSDAYLEVFQGQSQKAHELCEYLRTYLRIK